MTLGTKLRNLRTKKNISQEKLAEDIGVSLTAVNKWESDKAKPGFKNITNLCAYYNVDFNYLKDDKEGEVLKKATFTDNNYAGYFENLTINNAIPEDLLKTILDNQAVLSQTMQLQNELFQSLLERKC